MMSRSLYLVVTLACACLIGCDSGNMSESGESESASSGSEGDAVCAGESRNDEYAVGLAKTGESLTVTFVDASPAPPDRGENTWTVMVTDAGGQAVTEAELEVVPWMPDHGHGSSVVVEVTPTGTPGEFQLKPIDLFMAGLWEVRLNFTMPGGGAAETIEEQVVFAFCVER